ncbi:hypothetical protein QYE76_039675 [Lolium multiflorum]|uniref:Dirigent protein n=1 Tax=Lolium multiflorum TaxID=4521 RepID=A0AAD8WS06_LOLMU|nr:hypothetical protein QYE76_039675 [Lolium multiflorum]
MYMHETSSGPNATLFAAVPPRQQGGNTTFGMVALLDDELRDSPDPSNSSLVGRFQAGTEPAIKKIMSMGAAPPLILPCLRPWFQGIVAFAGLVSPPGMQSAITFVFTAGEHNGITLAMLGSIISFQGTFERSVVGGTGAFRMARGYCIMNVVSNPALVSVVYEVNLFVKVDA